MMKPIAIALLAASSATAYAGAPTPSDAPTSSTRAQAKRYVAISGIETDESSDHRGLALEAALPVGDGAFYVHGVIAVGKSKDASFWIEDDPTTGEPRFLNADGWFEQARVGFEARSSDAWVRVFGGIDLGYQADHRTYGPAEARMTEYVSSFVTVPRIGFEAGTRVRVRAALEVPLLEHFDGDGPDGVVGASLGLGYAF